MKAVPCKLPVLRWLSEDWLRCEVWRCRGHAGRGVHGCGMGRARLSSISKRMRAVEVSVAKHILGCDISRAVTRAARRESARRHFATARIHYAMASCLALARGNQIHTPSVTPCAGSGGPSGTTSPTAGQLLSISMKNKPSLTGSARRSR
jgi:hypothetical protein